MKNKFTAVILAAGMGTRLGDVTKAKPKALTDVCGKPIIERSILFARELGAKNIVVVGGYLFDALAEAVRAIDTDVVLVQNKAYETTEPLASLVCAQKEIKGGFISYNGDYIYETSIVEKIKKSLDDTVNIFGTSQESNEVQLDMKVAVNDKHNLVNMKKGLADYTHYFNSMFYCPKGEVVRFFESAHDVLKKGDPKNMNVESGILGYASSGKNVKMVDLGYPHWIEIDTPDELSVAERLIVSHPADYPC